MKKSTPALPASLQGLQHNHEALLKKLRGNEPLLIGSVYDVLRRCGNPSCRCAEKPTHKQTLFLFIQNGKRRCQFVRQGDVRIVREAWESYREFRKALKRIRAIHQREYELLLDQIKKRAVPYEKLI